MNAMRGRKFYQIITVYLLMIMTHVVVMKSEATQRVIWKVKPQPYQVAKEFDSVKLNCEFQYESTSDTNNKAVTTNLDVKKHFVIWYKDGRSQNVLSLNDQLAQLNASNYEINGTYNLVIKNLTKENSGLYTCQLFQSIDLVASVNLTVLVPPKYAQIRLRESMNGDDVDYGLHGSSSKGYLVEDDQIYLECCTNGDANPAPVFEWHRIVNPNATLSRVGRDNQAPMHHQTLTGRKTNTIVNGQRLCNVLAVNLTRSDNDYAYKCLINNDALFHKKPIEDSISLSVEYKPIVAVHLAHDPTITGRLTLITNSSIELYCNATARPDVLSYQWFYEDNLLRDHRTSTLVLNNLNKHNAGRYECKCANRHGISKSDFIIDILYAEIRAVNRTNELLDMRNLRESQAVFVSTYENSTLTLSCEIDSNPLNENVIWYYYELNKHNQVKNKVMLSSWISTITRVINETKKYYYSQLNLINVTSNHSGYYTCAVSSILHDGLNQTHALNANATYFLLVQYAPVVKPSRRIVYANNYDQVELSCEVNSNPQSIFSWYYGPKELFSSYKYNLSSVVYKQIQRTYLDDLDNVHHYKSKLVINSLTQFDYGEYICRASNLIGEGVQIIRLRRKQRPQTPADLKLVEITSNSVQLSWLSGSNGGENSTYVITINNSYNMSVNLDVDVDVNDETEPDNSQYPDESENKFNLIEIRGLKSNQAYEFKIQAVNSMGASDYSKPIKAITLKTTLKSDALPVVMNAQFNEQYEAICFDLDSFTNMIESGTALYAGIHKGMFNDVLVRIEIDLNELVAKENSTGLVEPRLKQQQQQPEPIRKKRTYLISISKLKLGQNCVSYGQLLEMDTRANGTSAQASPIIVRQQKHTNVYTIDSEALGEDGTFVTDRSGQQQQQQHHQQTSAFSKYAKVDYLKEQTFSDFKRLHKVNISLCYANDSSICSKKVPVIDYSTDFSTYLTLITIGCSTILIFIILLIASLCCCCCRRRQNTQKQQKHLKRNDLNSKLVIKSFPILSAQQTNYEYSDGSTKSSSQQHILNGSNGSNHSSGSGSSSFNEKTFYSSQNEPTVNIFGYSQTDHHLHQQQHLNHNHHHHHHLSSIATVESDASSSTSLENKTTSTSNGGKSSSTHSPYTLTTNDSTNQPYMTSASMSATSYTLQKSNQTNKPHTLVYTGANNIYIKSGFSQQQANNQKQFPIDANLESSSYSTPTNTSTNKKLVYEVIV